MITGPTIPKFILPDVIQATTIGNLFIHVLLAHRPFTRVILPDLLHIEPLVASTTTHPDFLFTKKDQIHWRKGAAYCLLSTPFRASSEFLYISGVLSWGHPPIPHSPASPGPCSSCRILLPTLSSVYKYTQDFPSLNMSFLNPASISNICLFPLSSLTPEVFMKSTR